MHGAIAAGGMATVHVGRLLAPGGFARRIAIKRLHPQFVADPEVAATFAEEARLSARIAHVNVAAVLDVVLEGGELLLVMEYVHGETLSRLLMGARNAALKVPIPVVLSVLTGVLHGLHAAHEAAGENGQPLRLVHRDVSPQNVIVGVDGVARVVDFGIAKAMGGAQVTRDGQLKGKMPYMAPEQLRRHSVDRRVDVYATGVILWEALAGKRLFVAEDESALFGKVLEDVVVKPSTFNPDVSPALDAIVMHAIERDPDKRFATAHELAVAIEHLGTHAPASVVAEWVTRNAREALDKRMAQISEMEREAPAAGLEDTRPDVRGPSASVIFRDATPGPIGFAVATPTTTMGIRPPAKPRRLASFAIALAVAALLAVGIIVGVTSAGASRKSETATVATLPPIEATPIVSAVTPPVSASSEPSPVAPAPTAPTATATTTTSTAATAPLRPVRAPAVQWCKVFDSKRGVYVMKSMRVSRCP